MFVSILGRPESRPRPAYSRHCPDRTAEVSILGRPESRPRQSCVGTGASWPPSFNPRPAREPAATCAITTQIIQALMRFNPRPAREPAATGSYPVGGQDPMFQSSAGPRAGRDSDPAISWATAAPVSILGRPESRPRRSDRSYRKPLRRSLFQSSAGPRAGRDGVPSTVRSPRRKRFNPRPAQEPAATRSFAGDAASHRLFQSSAGPRAGRDSVHLPSNSMVEIPFQSSAGPRAGRDERTLSLCHRPL